MDELSVTLNRDSSTPLGDQVASELRKLAIAGRLRVGDRLPSSRSLAATLGVSRTVTAAAFDQLLAEGWLVARRGSGTYVAAVPPAPSGMTTPGRFLPAGRGLQTAPAPGEPTRRGHSDAVVDLRPGSPWAAGLRPDMWRRAWRAAADRGPDGRTAHAGSAAFCEAVAEHVVRHRGLVVSAESVLATAGTTAAVTELALGVLRRGDTVVVEEPGYPRAVGAFRAAGIRVQPVRVDSEGLVVDELPANVRSVYCTPAHQYPLGSRLSAGRRIALVEWARRHGGLLIEDDYDGELRYDVAPLPLLAALGPDVVVHLGTTSKTLTPTLGVGWMVGPQDVTDAVIAYREVTSTAPSLAGQRVFTAMIASGDLSRHLRHVRKELAARRDDVVRHITSAGLNVIGDEAGAHVVVPLADQQAERWAVAEGRRGGVLVDGLQRCFAAEPTTAGVTLGYAAPASRSELTRGLDLLTATLTATLSAVVET